MHGTFCEVTLLESIAVDDDGQVVQLVMRGRESRLPVAALLELAVTCQHKCAPRRAIHLGRERTSNGDRQAVPERSGIGFDTWHLGTVGMATEAREGLHVRAELLDVDKAGFGERGVQCAGAMAL